MDAGRQRVRVLKLKGGCKAEVLVLGEDSLLKPPKEAAADIAAWGSWVYQSFDSHWLADQASQAYTQFAPHVQSLASNATFCRMARSRQAKDPQGSSFSAAAVISGELAAARAL